MVLLTRKQLPVVLKLDLYSFSFFFGGGGGGNDLAQTTVTRPTLRASFEVNFCPIFKTNTPLQSPFHNLNGNSLLARIQREMTPWRSFEISGHFAAHHAERNDSDQVYFAGFVWSHFTSNVKEKDTVAKALWLAKRGCLVGENPTRNTSMTVVQN